MASKVLPLSTLYQDLQGLVDDSRPQLPPVYLGRHVLGEYFDCDRLPTQPQILQKQLEDAARLIHATVVQSVFHEFNPYGLSGVVVIAESHLAIHTWPEHRCASVDLYTCSLEIDPRPAFEYLNRVFRAGRYDVLEIPRGAALATRDAD